MQNVFFFFSRMKQSNLHWVTPAYSETNLCRDLCPTEP